MKEWFRWVVASIVLVMVASYAWTHARHVAVPANAFAAQDSQPKYAEQQQAGQMVTVTGPMADYMARQKAGVETLEPTARPVSYSVSEKSVDQDHVNNDSPVGTSTALLRRTFTVARIVDVPFELPPHASTPNLRGTYRSFLAQSGQGEEAPDDQAEVEFLVLNDSQFADLLAGRPVDAVFSADAVSNGEVDFTMPPTFAKPAKYHLIFRNSSPAKEKTAVQTDFRLDF
jgi:hypothetical protein